MVRIALIASAAFGVSANLLRQPAAPKSSFPTVEPPETPKGIIDEDADPAASALLVECSEDVDVPTKQIFSAMMGCNREISVDTESKPLCDNFNDGGCDNEVCHEFCHKMFTSANAYQTCKCKNWDAAKSFKEHAPGAPCPLKIQPRCYNGNLYRTECEALAANEGVSAADLTVKPVADWPEDDMTAVKEGAC